MKQFTYVLPLLILLGGCTALLDDYRNGRPESEDTNSSEAEDSESDTDSNTDSETSQDTDSADTASSNEDSDTGTGSAIIDTQMCLYQCMWDEESCTTVSGGTLVDATCLDDQFCCNVDDEIIPPCEETCKPAWECAASAVTGNCHTTQQVCCPE